MMGDVCEGLGYSRPRIHLPFLLIILVAALFEYVIRPLVAPFKTLNTDFTVNRWGGERGAGSRHPGNQWGASVMIRRALVLPSQL